MGARLSWLILLQLSSVLVHGYDNVGFDGWYQPVPHRPVDIITDVINDLGVRILQQYTAHGNVAFSPTGVGFVLAALYEGSAGRARQQIADALGLPRDRDITRIGFRDIHRRLRTYLNADGFLGGLTLNQENTKLRPEYEDILRFYGFDLSVPDEETNETTSAPETTTETATEAKTISDEAVTARTMINSESTRPTLVEMLGMTLSSADEQNRLTQTTPGSTILTDAVKTTTSLPSSAINPLSRETTIADTTTTFATITEAFEIATTVPVQNETSEESTSTRLGSSSTGTSIATQSILSSTGASISTESILSTGASVAGESISSTTNIPITSESMSSTTTSSIATQSISTSTSIPVTESILTLTASSGNIEPISSTTNSPVPTQSTLSTTTSPISTESMSSTTNIPVTARSTLSTTTSPISTESMSSTTNIPVTIQSTLSTTASPVSTESTLSTTASPITTESTLSTTIAPIITESVSSTTTSPIIESVSSTTASPIQSQAAEEEAASTESPQSPATPAIIFTSEPASENANPESTESGTSESTTTIEAISTVLAAQTSTTSPVNVTEVSASSTIPIQADPSAGSMFGPPVDENTVSTDSGNNQSIPIEMGSSDLPVTSVATGETGSTEQQLTTVATMSRRKRGVRSPRGFFSSYPDEGIWMQDLGIWKPYSTTLNEASVRDSTEISFLVNGCDVSSVTASRYFAVLPFAYFPSLHAVALEFPLDDPRYNILLMMATDRRDTYKLARDLGGKSLRLLRKQLQATWVRATIPSFMLRGFVTLTSFLQRLGILDVFEPRAADLSLMTPDLGVYARDVQQSIGVNIRNYMKPDRTHSRNGLFERAGPVPFTVVHPFLYFIVDAETSVALIAGRVNDPLNSRIL